MRLKDKVVLVTASTRGIGLACVKACAKEGAIVYMAARNLERAQEIADALSGVKCVYNDATRPETFTTMVEDVVRDAGRIDVLVNNFGTSNPGKDLDFANTDPQMFLDTINLNLRSVFLASQAAAKHMATQGGGSIINISSVGGIVPDISQISYGQWIYPSSDPSGLKNIFPLLFVPTDILLPVSADCFPGLQLKPEKHRALRCGLSGHGK